MNLDKRMQTHRHSKHAENNDSNRKYSSTTKVEYCKFDNRYQMDIYEIHLINKINPKYNKDFNYNDPDLFDLPDVVWNKYLFKTFARAFSIYWVTSDDYLRLSTPKESLFRLSYDAGWRNYYADMQNSTEFVNLYFAGMLDGEDDPLWDDIDWQAKLFYDREIS